MARSTYDRFTIRLLAGVALAALAVTGMAPVAAHDDGGDKTPT